MSTCYIFLVREISLRSIACHCLTSCWCWREGFFFVTGEDHDTYLSGIYSYGNGSRFNQIIPP